MMIENITFKSGYNTLSQIRLFLENNHAVGPWGKSWSNSRFSLNYRGHNDGVYMFEGLSLLLDFVSRNRTSEKQC